MVGVQRPISLGVESTEIVIRGGHLKSPLVMTGLAVVDHIQFIKLRKTNKVLSSFLTDKPAFQRPLAKTLVFEKLGLLRNAKYHELLVEVQTAGTEGQGEEEQEIDDLGLDEPEVGGRLSNWSRHRGRYRAAVKLIPRMAIVSFERPGQLAWEPMLLMESATKVPAMECSTANLQAMFALVQLDLSDGSVHRPQHGRQREQAQTKPPRLLADGSREYWIRGGWVRKIRLAAPIPPADPPDGRKFKTLKRRSSDELAKAKPKQANRSAKARGVGRTATSRAFVADVPGHAVDDLELDL
jgi:hypothetical protein